MKTIQKIYNTYRLYNEETDITYITNNITKFCEEMGLPYHAIYQMVHGRSQKSNGFIRT